MIAYTLIIPIICQQDIEGFKTVMTDNKTASKNQNPLINHITGVILAGGKSSRYGKNKALVKLNGVMLIEKVKEVMSSIFKNLIIITNTPEEYEFLQLPMYQDLVKGMGPVGGIHTGLHYMDNDAAFFVACDMPFLNKDLISYMAECLDDYDAVIPKIDWKIEALHAIYSKRCLPAVASLIELREYQVIKFHNQIQSKFIGENEIKSFDPHLISFMNVNRPEEFKEAEKILTTIN